MRIAICTNHFAPSIGGCEYVTEAIARYLSQFHEVLIFTQVLPKREKTLYLPLQIVEYYPKVQSDFLRKMKTANPDVILIYSDVFDFFKEIVIFPNDLKAKIIVALCGANWLHANRPFALTFLRNIEKIHAIVCHSTYDRDYRFCSSKDLSQKTHVIPNGVNLGEFSDLRDKQSLASMYSLDPNKIWIVNVSNFFPGKGQEHTIDVIRQLSRNDIYYIQISHDIPFVVGEVLESKWRKKALDLGDQVRLLKNVPRKDILSILSASNVFISTSEKEVAPIVMLEAMACQLPWVSTNVGNVEGLRGGICVASPKDSSYKSIFTPSVITSIASAIGDVLRKPTLGRDGRRQVEREFNWDTILPLYKILVEQ